jgi:hypothetical protein
LALPLVALLAYALLPSAGGTVAGGPLRAPDEHGWAVSRVLGSTFTDGFETLELRGHQDARLVAVTLVGDPAVKLVGVSLVRLHRGLGSIEYMPTYPPHSGDLPQRDVVAGAIGKPITPIGRTGLDWELLLGIRVTALGRHERDGINVVYSVHGQRYQQFLPAKLAVCGTRTPRPLGACRMPKPET